MKSIGKSVGKNAINDPKDIETIIHLLKERKGQSVYAKAMSKVDVPGTDDADVVGNLTKAIKAFQKDFQKMRSPDGIVSPSGNTILYLGGVRAKGKVIMVDLEDQNLFAYDGTDFVYEFHCATGDDAHPTATWPEVHKIFRKHKVYRSKKYNAQMDFAMFFTYDGKAIHKSNAVTVTSFLKDLGLDQLGSHGCVRLSGYDAQKLFSWAPMLTPVFIDLEKI